MTRQSARIASKMIRWEDIPVSSYDNCHENQRSIDLQLKQFFLQMGEFVPCENKEFIGEQYDGILVTTKPFTVQQYDGTMKTESYTFCLSGRLLRNIEDPDFIEATVCEKGISWDIWE